MKRKARLFPLAVLDRRDLQMDAGQAAPKQTSMIASNMLMNDPFL
jgi:hypothetical protein